jgi:hypothetical protein
MMPEVNEFKITNPRAPFFILQELLEHTDVPMNRRGDLKWIKDNLDSISVPEDVIIELTNVVNDLCFVKDGE